MPYEFQPLPAVGAVVKACNRKGKYVCWGRVVARRQLLEGDGCWSLTVAVPKTYLHDVRHVVLPENP